MSTSPSPLVKPVTRRIGNLVVTIDMQGVTLRRYRGRRRKFFSWERIMALSESDRGVLTQAEFALGARQLDELLGGHFLRHANAGGRNG